MSSHFIFYFFIFFSFSLLRPLSRFLIPCFFLLSSHFLIFSLFSFLLPLHTCLLFPSPYSFTLISYLLFSCFSLPFILFLPSFSSFPTPFFSSSPLGFLTPVYFLFFCFLLSYFFYIPIFPLVTILYFSFCFSLLFSNALVFLSSPSFNFVISHFLLFYLLLLVSSLLPLVLCPSPTLLVSSTQLFSSTCLLYSSSSHFLL